MTAARTDASTNAERLSPSSSTRSSLSRNSASTRIDGSVAVFMEGVYRKCDASAQRSLRSGSVHAVHAAATSSLRSPSPPRLPVRRALELLVGLDKARLHERQRLRHE